MVGLAIRFELGRYHANPWGSHVNEAASEWPPSPWRLLRALYSVARTNVRLADRQPAIDRALGVLASAPPPVFELPPAVAGHTRHYMPLATYSPLRRGDTAKVIDGFLAVDPEAELRAWWDAALDAEGADALAAAARALGYLGRSESVCSARVITAAKPEWVSAAPVESGLVVANEADMVELLCLEPTAPLEKIAVSVTELRQQRLLEPPGTRRVTYTVELPEPVRAASRRPQPPLPTLALLRVVGSERPAITEAVAVGQSLRRALQSLYGRANGKAASPTFSGRAGDRPRADQHQHAHYLALPGAHERRVETLIVWAPEGLQSEEVAALASLRNLKLHGTARPLTVALGSLGAAHQLDVPELIGPARRWESVTPFGLVRHPKRRGGAVRDSPEDQVRQELAYRRLPEPEQIELTKGSWHRFRSSRVGGSRLDRTGVVGVRLSFPEEVRGPITLGALSHYGLGLMRPE